MAYFTIQDFAAGTRIELHPATDRWMRGDRYGTVRKVGRKVLQVSMDRSNKVIRVAPDNIGAVIDGNGQKAFSNTMRWDGKRS